MGVRAVLQARGQGLPRKRTGFDTTACRSFRIRNCCYTTSDHTQEGVTVGTPEYMSPEQAQGIRPDARTDLFSLGSVLFELCVGRTPFRSLTPLESLMAVIHQPTPSVRELSPSVPPAIADMVGRLLEKDPERRPSTASNVAEELRAIERDLVNARLQLPVIVSASNSSPRIQATSAVDAEVLEARDQVTAIFTVEDVKKFEEPKKSRSISKKRARLRREEAKRQKLLIVLGCCGAALLLTIILVVALSSRNKDKESDRKPTVKLPAPTPTQQVTPTVTVPTIGTLPTPPKIEPKIEQPPPPEPPDMPPRPPKFGDLWRPGEPTPPGWPKGKDMPQGWRHGDPPPRPPKF